MRTICLLLLAVTFMAGIAAHASEAEFGTAAEARAMLDKAVAAIKTDKEGALSKMTRGADGFKDRDLYPFCAGPDGNFTAHPTLVGKSLLNLRDKTGKAIGQEMFDRAKEGAVAEVAYVWVRPGTGVNTDKVSFVTKADDQICAVGYYKDTSK